MNPGKATSGPVLAILLAGFLFGSTGMAAAACGNGKLLFEDKFQTLAESWMFGGSSDRPNAGRNGLTAAIAPEHAVYARKSDSSYRDVDICGVAAISNKNSDGGFFAIRFWFDDSGTSYWAVAFPGKGLFWVQRLPKDSKPVRLTPKTFNPALVNASGTNEFRVRLKGDTGAFIVNGKRVSNFTREAPGSESAVGFIAFPAESPEPTTFALKSFETRELGTDQVPAASSLIKFCNEFAQTLRVAIAYQIGDAWTSEGWITLKPNACEAQVKHPDLVSFYYRAESDVYDGQRMIFGANRDFAVQKTDFLIRKADAKSKGVEMQRFTGPVERVSPAQDLSVVFEATAGRVAVVKGRKPE